MEKVALQVEAPRYKAKIRRTASINFSFGTLVFCTVHSIAIWVQNISTLIYVQAFLQHMITT